MTQPVIRVFISSPEDVAAERCRAAQAVERLNGEFSRRVHIEPILWEEHFYSSLSSAGPACRACRWTIPTARRPKRNGRHSCGPGTLLGGPASRTMPKPTSSGGREIMTRLVSTHPDYPQWKQNLAWFDRALTQLGQK